MSVIRTLYLVVIGTDCTGSCKSNYYTIATTTALAITSSNAHWQLFNVVVYRTEVQLSPNMRHSLMSCLKCPIVESVMVNNSANINKMNNPLSPKLTDHKMTTTNDVGKKSLKIPKG